MFLKLKCWFQSVVKRDHILLEDGSTVSHLEEYLTYYSRLEKPGYAVLVTGAWGTGKTFQVLKHLKEDQRYYISLFGVQSVDHLHSEVLAIAAPWLTKGRDFAADAGQRIKNLGGFASIFGIVPDVAIAVMRRELKPDRILVFDDLERSELSLKDLLGAINFYIEQRGFRVVVIAHDEQLADSFIKMKEKTFGQTIRVEPHIDDAFESFVSPDLASSARGFLLLYRPEIIETFKQSEVMSLRILRHVIEDLVRLSECLNAEHLCNSNAMSELVRFYSALNIEVREGRLNADTLRDRNGVATHHMVRALSRGGGEGDEVSEPPLLAANNRYPSVDLEGRILSDDVLIATLIEGRYPPEKIQECLNNSVHFLKPAEAPPWRVVINFDELDDDTVESGKARMRRQFEDRAVTDPGEMLHVFSLMMLMAENSEFSESLSEVTAQCKTYIDDLLASNSLPARHTDYRWYREYDDAHNGYAYWVTDTTRSHHEDVRSHLFKAQQLAFDRTVPDILTQLIELIKTDTQRFLELVSYTSSGDNKYAGLPVFHLMSAKVFVDAWLNSPRDSWRKVKYALDNRYSEGQMRAELEPERGWAVNVFVELERRARETKGLTSLRIRRIIPKALKIFHNASEEAKELAKAKMCSGTARRAGKPPLVPKKDRTRKSKAAQK